MSQENYILETLKYQTSAVEEFIPCNLRINAKKVVNQMIDKKFMNDVGL